MLLSRSLKLAVLGLALIAGGCDRQSREPTQPQASQGAEAEDASKGGKPATGTIDRSHKGSQLPDFTLSDAQGRKIRLQELKGKPLLLNLWATWCAPCVVELPMLDRLAASKGSTLKVLTVSQDMQTDKVASFLKDRGITQLEPWLDPENDLSFHYATGTLPTTIFYDAEGREAWRLVGGHDWTGAETEATLAEGMED